MTEILRQILTPQDVLNIFIEEHRLCSPLDPEADPDAKLTMNSTIGDWRDANDLVTWQPLYKFLNKSFDIQVSEEEWKNVLEPPFYKPLKGVCELIAKHSSRENIKPIKLLGSECLSAAVFLTLKKQLQLRQVDVTGLKPSSLVTPYLDTYYSIILEQTTIISNGQQVFEKLDVKRRKRGFFNYINIFDKKRYTILTGEIKTFRDLILKIIELNKQQEKRTG